MNLDLSWDAQSMWNGMGEARRKTTAAAASRDSAGRESARSLRERHVELGGPRTRVDAALRARACAVASELALCEVAWEVEVRPRPRRAPRPTAPRPVAARPSTIFPPRCGGVRRPRPRDSAALPKRLVLLAPPPSPPPLFEDVSLFPRLVVDEASAVAVVTLWLKAPEMVDARERSERLCSQNNCSSHSKRRHICSIPGSGTCVFLLRAA
ncbi:hypothetical protein DFH09DRAFT_1090695 [Mycena vulgaris]|nr:hypothetical protein DFH09DRAFT_1090695 [Mycena vulgaris]